MNYDAKFDSVLTIDLDAIMQNWRWMQHLLGPQSICAAVVKADAYGLGIAKIAPTLWQAGCRTFFVALPQEGFELKTFLPDEARIFVLNGFTPGTETDHLTGGTIPVLNDLAAIKRWRTQAHRSSHVLPAALHLDTGMNRLGLETGEIMQLIQATKEILSGLEVQIIMTHLAAADQRDHPMTEQQIRLFKKWQQALAVQNVTAPVSLANSAGILLHPETYGNLARPGIALYGVVPDSKPANTQIKGLCPAITLHARILQIRCVDRNETVGYGCNYRVTQPARIATVAFGYADGLMRRMSDTNLPVVAAYFAGYRLPLVGRVSMDLAMFDISDIPVGQIQSGMWVELIGPQQTLGDLAVAADTISYELLVRLGSRSQHIYLGGLQETD